MSKYLIGRTRSGARRPRGWIKKNIGWKAAALVAAVTASALFGRPGLASANGPVAKASFLSMRMGILTMPPPPAQAATVSITASGANGVGRSSEPGLGCAAGGDGPSWHYGYETVLPPGRFTSLPTDLRLNLDVHGDALEIGPQPQITGFLKGEESTASLVNERGTVVLRLTDGGSCDHRTAALSPTTASTSGTWAVDRGSGSFATADGRGTFTVEAGIAPGADNPWTVDLSGSVTVSTPSLQVTQVDTYWGALGLDYLTRRPTVVLQVTNTGAGDAFGVRLTGAASPTPGVNLLSGAPAELGDLLAGESTEVVLRYQLGLLSPCAGVILNCRFDVSAATTTVDAFDTPITDVDLVSVSTPLLAPPL